MKSKTLLLTLAAALTGGLLAADNKPAGDSKVKPYPLNECVVSGEKLGNHGKPYVLTNGTQEVKLCCKGCLKDFNKESAKYLGKIKQSQPK